MRRVSLDEPQALEVVAADPMPGRLPRRSVPAGLWTAYRQAERQLLDLPSPDALSRYKGAVRQLAAHALASYEAATEFHFGCRGGFKRLVYIRALEQTLDELTPGQVTKWAGVRLLQRLDLVRGLLLDLFA